MGLLDNTTQNQYYQGNDFGNYQFVSLEDIINQFMVVYVGDQKIINKASRIDVAFHAQRALAELSFDTFKSTKAQEIEIPPTLQMTLPQDYVNYTKLSCVDSSGIKHPLYPTKHTSNPFEILQNSDGTYFFGEEANNVLNPSFDASLNGTWSSSTPSNSSAWDSTRITATGRYFLNLIADTQAIVNGELTFGQLWYNGYGSNGPSRAYGAWQRIDVEFANTIDLTAVATSGARQTATVDGVADTLICDYGVVRVGITYTDPDIGWPHATTGNLIPATKTPPGGNNKSPNYNSDNYELGYVEWSDGTSSQKELEDIDVSNYTEVWVYIQSYSPWTTSAVTTMTAGTIGGTTPIAPTSVDHVTHQENSVGFVSVIVPGQIQTLSSANEDNNSSTWNNYKSLTPSENNNDDYEDDTYWPAQGERYGLEPSHAQVNGSFYIDEIRGKIHFSSNISGKTVILDYISDSLGTDSEMKVHKFAEEAMYRWILHAIASGRIQTQQIVPRLKKEKFAAVRQAKLRLSNIKLEEITQILRGKSKQIKH